MEIIPGLHRLPGIMGVNTYLRFPSGSQPADVGPCLFDCGFPWSVRALVANMSALGCEPADLATIAVTHDDIDHVGRLASLQAVSGAQVVAHRLEAVRLAGDTWRELPAFQRLSCPLKAVGGLYARRGRHPVRVGRPVEDGDVLPGGWIAVHTPGHTPGHTSFFYPEMRVLIAGDALGSVRNRQVRGPQPFFTEDPEAGARSVRKLSELEPDVICFGHGAELFSAAEPLRKLAGLLEAKG